MSLKVGYVGKDGLKVIGYVKDNEYLVVDEAGRYITMNEADIIKQEDTPLEINSIVELHSTLYGIPTRGMIVGVLTNPNKQVQYDVLLEHNRCVARMSHDKLMNNAIKTKSRLPYSNPMVVAKYNAGFRFGGNFNSEKDAQTEVLGMFKKVSHLLDQCLVINKAYGPDGKTIEGGHAVWVKYKEPILGKPAL